MSFYFSYGSVFLSRGERGEVKYWQQYGYYDEADKEPHHKDYHGFGESGPFLH